MKINKLWGILFATATLVACNSGSNSAQSQQIDATHTALTGTLANNSVKDYVNQLASAKISNGNQRVEKLRQQLIAYYSKVPVVQTVEAKGYTVDCIPFDQQPGLINASAADKATADALNKKHLAAMAKAGNGIDKIAAGFDFKMTMCPESTVAIARFDANNLDRYIKKAAPPGLQANNNAALNIASKINQNFVTQNKTKSVGSFGVEYSIYSWIISYFSNTYVTDPAVFTTFISPDPTVSNSYMVNDNDGHSLNQLWWLDYTDTSMYSLETGWIVWPVSGGCDQPASVRTELFVFSTPDDYDGSIPYEDNYNQNGGFIQYSNTPVTIGTPLNSSQKFTLSYTKLTDDSGYELRYGSNGVTQPVGYYPITRYPTTPNFTDFSYGSEIANSNNEPMTMGGTIVNAGTMNESNNILSQDTPARDGVGPQGEYTYSYTMNSDGSVTYSGTHGVAPTPTPSTSPTPTPTNVPGGAPEGQYTDGASTINWDGTHLSAVYNGVTTPVLNYADTCADGAAVSVNNGVLSCSSFTPGLQQISSTEAYTHGYWPSSCAIQDVSVDTSISSCAGTTALTAGAACVNQVQAYCQNSSGSYVQTSFNPNGSGCYDSTNQIWNIALNSSGQLYCPTTVTR